MSLKASKSKLGRATRDLMAQWDDVLEYWRDQQAAGFDKKYISHLPDSVSSAVVIIDELDAVLTKIKSDCE